MTNQIEFTRVNNDVNGNPRYVCHYSALINSIDTLDAQLEALKENVKVSNYGKGYVFAIDLEYKKALAKARKIGGKKFHNKQYGGGISFQSYNLPDLEKSILELQNA